MDQRKQSYRSALNVWLRFPFTGKPIARAFGLTEKEGAEVEADDQMSGEGHPKNLWTAPPGWKLGDRKTAAVVRECVSNGLTIGWTCVCDKTGEMLGIVRQQVGKRKIQVADSLALEYVEEEGARWWKAVEILN